MSINYKRNEGVIIQELLDYVNATYSQHYTSDTGRDVCDDWESMGIAKEAYMSNIVKYAKRFGKKAGYNRKDIIKIMHYCIFLLNEIDNADESVYRSV